MAPSRNEVTETATAVGFSASQTKELLDSFSQQQFNQKEQEKKENTLALENAAAQDAFFIMQQQIAEIQKKWAEAEEELNAELLKEKQEALLQSLNEYYESQGKPPVGSESNVQKEDLQKDLIDKQLLAIQVQKEEIYKQWGGKTWEEGLQAQAQKAVTAPLDGKSDLKTTIIKDIIPLEQLSDLDTTSKSSLSGMLDKRIEALLEKLERTQEDSQQIPLLTAIKFAGVLKQFVDEDMAEVYKRINAERAKQDLKPVEPPKISVARLADFVNKNCQGNIQQFQESIKGFLKIHELEREEQRLLTEKAGLSSMAGQQVTPTSTISSQPTSSVQIRAPGTESTYDCDRGTASATFPNSINARQLMSKASAIVSSEGQTISTAKVGNTIQFSSGNGEAFTYSQSTRAFNSVSSDPQDIRAMLRVSDEIFPGQHLEVSATGESIPRVEQACSSLDMNNVNIREVTPQPIKPAAENEEEQQLSREHTTSTTPTMHK